MNVKKIADSLENKSKKKLKAKNKLAGEGGIRTPSHLVVKEITYIIMWHVLVRLQKYGKSIDGKVERPIICHMRTSGSKLEFWSISHG